MARTDKLPPELTDLLSSQRRETPASSSSLAARKARERRNRINETIAAEDASAAAVVRPDSAVSRLARKKAVERVNARGGDAFDFSVTPDQAAFRTDINRRRQAGASEYMGVPGAAAPVVGMQAVENQGILESAAKSFAGGFADPADALPIYKLAAGNVDPRVIQQVAETERQRMATPISQGSQEFSEAETVMQALKQAVTNPQGMIDMQARSLGGQAGSIIAAPVTGPAGFGANSAYLEFANEIRSLAAKAGFNLQDEASITDLLNQPKVWDGIVAQARIKASIVGGVDAATAGLGGLLPGGQTIKKQLGTIAAGTVLEGAAGAGGEALSQYAVRDAVDEPAAVVQEGLAEVPGGALQVAQLAGKYRGRYGKKGDATPAPSDTNTPPPAASGMDAVERPQDATSVPDAGAVQPDGVLGDMKAQIEAVVGAPVESADVARAILNNETSSDEQRAAALAYLDAEQESDDAAPATDGQAQDGGATQDGGVADVVSDGDMGASTQEATPARAADVMLPSINDMSDADVRARARELGVEDRGPISVVRRRVEAAQAAPSDTQAPQTSTAGEQTDSLATPLAESERDPAAPQAEPDAVAPTAGVRTDNTPAQGGSQSGTQQPQPTNENIGGNAPAQQSQPSSGSVASPNATPTLRDRAREAWIANIAKVMPDAPRNDKAAEKAAQYIEQAISTGQMNPYMEPQNKGARKTFEQLTGLKLPKSLRDTKAFFKGQPFAVKDAAPSSQPASGAVGPAASDQTRSPVGAKESDLSPLPPGDPARDGGRPQIPSQRTDQEGSSQQASGNATQSPQKGDVVTLTGIAARSASRLKLPATGWQLHQEQVDGWTVVKKNGDRWQEINAVPADQFVRERRADTTTPANPPAAGAQGDSSRPPGQQNSVPNPTDGGGLEDTPSPAEQVLIQATDAIKELTTAIRDLKGEAPAAPPVTETPANPPNAEVSSPSPEPTTPNAVRGSDTITHSDPIVRQVADYFLAGNSFANIIDARKWLGEKIGTPIKPGTPQAKAADEQLEQGVVLAARRIVADGRANGTPATDVYQRLVQLYDQQPRFAVRSSTSMRNQAYSTPAPLAFVASQLAGITPTTTVYEPTAGTGLLLIGASADNVQANELNTERVQALRDAGFNATQSDATELKLPQPVDVIIANPPFGEVKNDDGKAMLWDIAGYTTPKVDQAIMLKALESLKDGGRAVFIIGGKKGTQEERKKAYRSYKTASFFKRVMRDYNVTDHFTVSGDLYEKQGAGFPVDVLVIEGRSKSARSLPGVDVPRVYDSWEQLSEVLANATLAPQSDAASTGVVPPGSNAGATGGASAANVEGSDGAGVSRPADDAAGVDGGTRKRPGGRGGKRGAGSAKRPTDGSGRVPTQQDVGQSEGGVADGNQPSDGAGESGRNDPTDDLSGLDQRSDADRSDVNTEEETALQVRYTAASGNKIVGTLVPRNMQQATKDALARLAEKHGNLDKYVASKLGYSATEFRNNFSAEQADALALAIDNVERGRGFIIGDQTGVGKGRVVAGMLRWANRNGLVPVFVTEKPNLYADIVRDLGDIGMPGLNLLPTNADLRGKDSIPLPDGRVLTSLKDAPTEIMKLARGEKTSTPYFAIATVYSQLQTHQGKTTPRREALMALAPRAMFIFDESHNAGGQTQNDRFVKKDAPLNRAQFARMLVQNARAVMYSSATYAKRPQVMDLYSATDMKLAVSNIKELAVAISNGGVAMQQVVASMLAEAGQYIRRERSFAKVVFGSTVVTADRVAANEMASIFRAVAAFDKAKAGAVKDVSDNVSGDAAQVANDTATGKSGITSTNFTSIMHNVVDQYLLASKVDAAATEIAKALSEGRKPVIALSNTMEGLIEQTMTESGATFGDSADVTFRDAMLRYLERSRTLTIQRKGEKPEKHYLTDAELGEAGVAAYNEARAVIERAAISNVPASPIDLLIAKLSKIETTDPRTGERRNVRVNEITGREVRIDYSRPVPIYARRPPADATPGGRVKIIAGFQNGDIDVLILNQSGATGISLHAELKRAKDLRQRHMFILQADRNIDTFMQMLGRVHRTGQVIEPRYNLMASDLPGEKRPASVLMKKLASLNASVTADRKGAVDFDVPDVINEVGSQAAMAVLKEDPSLATRLDMEIDDDEEVSETEPEKFVAKMTGKMALLGVDEQEEVWQRIEQHYDDLLAEMKRRGRNPLQADRLDLQAKTLSKSLFTQPKADPTSPFAQPSYAEKVSVVMSTNMLTGDKVKAAWEATVGDKSPSQWAEDQVADLRTRTLKYLESRKANKTDAQVEAMNTSSNTMFRTTGNALRNFPPGTAVSIVSDNGNERLVGVVIGYRNRTGSGNPSAPSSWEATIAVPEYYGTIPVPVSQMTGMRPRYQVSEIDERDRTQWDSIAIGAKNIYEVFDTMASNPREERYILTGNLLSAYDERLNPTPVFFTRDDGRTDVGLLMPREFSPGDAIAGRAMSFTKAANVATWLRESPGGAQATTTDGVMSVMMSANGKDVSFRAPASRARGGQYFLNQKATTAAGRDFVTAGGNMVLDVPMDKAAAVIQAYMDTAVTFQVASTLTGSVADQAAAKYRQLEGTLGGSVPAAPSVPTQENRNPYGRERGGMAINPFKETAALTGKLLRKGRTKLARNMDRMELLKATRIAKNRERRLVRMVQQEAAGAKLMADQLGEQNEVTRAMSNQLAVSRKAMRDARRLIENLGAKLAKSQTKAEETAGKLKDANKLGRMAISQLRKDDAARAREDAQRDKRDARREAREAVAKERAETQRLAREGVARIAETLPLRMRGRFVSMTRDAKNMGDLFKAIVAAEQEQVADVRRRSKKIIDKLTSKKVRNRMTEEARQQLDAIGAQGRSAWSESASPENAEKMATLADQAKEIVHTVRAENKLIRSGMFIDAEIKRQAVLDVIETLEGKGIADDGVTARQPSLLLDVLHRGNFNAHTIAAYLDNDNFGNGTVADLFAGLKDGREKRFLIKEAAFAQADAAAARAGFDNLRHMMAVTSGLLGEGLVEKRRVRLAGQEVTLSLGTLAKIYSTVQDESTWKLIRAGKPMRFKDAGLASVTIGSLTDADVDAVRDALPVEVIDAINVMKSVRDKMFPAVQQSVRLLKGWEPPREPGYEPRTLDREFQAWREEITVGPAGETKLIENAGFLIARVNDKTTPLLMGDFFEDWTRTIAGQADVIAMAIPVRNARVVLLDPKVKAAIASRFGDRAVQRIREILIDASGMRADPGGVVAAAQFITRNVAVSKTALRLTSLLIQMAGVPRLWAAMDNDAAFRAGIAGAFSPKLAERMMAGSPMLRERYSGTIASINSTLADASTHVVVENDRTLADLMGKAKLAGKALAADVKAGDVKGALLRAWPELADTIRVSNFFDSIPARIAWAGFEAEAARRGEGVEWVRKHAEAALEQVLNSSEPLQLSGFGSKMRNNIGVLATAFTTDATSAYNQLVMGVRRGGRHRARTIAGMAMSIAYTMSIVGLVDYAFRSLTDDDEKDETLREAAMYKAMIRGLQESLGMSFVGNKLTDEVANTVATWGFNRPDLFDSLATGAVNDFARNVLNAGVATYDRATARFSSEQKEAEQKLAESLLRAIESGGSILRNPFTGPIAAARRGLFD